MVAGEAISRARVRETNLTRGDTSKVPPIDCGVMDEKLVTGQITGGDTYSTDFIGVHKNSTETSIGSTTLDI